jgi:hypothetical protein
MKIILALFVLLVSSCASLSNQEQLIGLSRHDIVRCMGQADKQEQQNDQERLSFSGSEENALCPLKKLAGQKPTQRYCKAVFLFKEGKVESVRYQAVDGSDITDDSVCSFLIKNCVE